MKVNPLKARFSELLRHQLKLSRIPQRQIAETLGISPSAICQIMRGYTMPKLAHFNILCEMLAIPRDIAQELRSMRTQIRAGDTKMPSNFNVLLRGFREQRGISTAQLANLTGMNHSEVKLLEECPEAIPTASECECLADVLECQAVDLLAAAGLSDAHPAQSEVSAALPEVAEPQVEYARGKKAAHSGPGWHPVLSLKMLPSDEGLNIAEFAQRRAIDYKYAPDLPEGCIILRGAAREIGFRDKGLFEAAVMKAPTPSHKIALARQADGWVLGIMLPYRRFNRFDGGLENAPTERLLWLVVHLTLSMDM